MKKDSKLNEEKSVGGFMNKIKIFLILALMILPINVFAEGNNISLECSQIDAKIGGTVECTVSAICDSSCSSFEFGLGVNDGLSFTTDFVVPATNLFEESSSNLPNDHIVVTKKDSATAPINSQFAIGSFTVKVLDSATVGNNYSITLSNGTIKNDDSTALASNISTNANIRALANIENGILSDLRVVSGGNLVPAFDKNSTTFSVLLDSAETTKFKLAATAEDSLDRVSAKNTDTGEAIDLNNEITFKPGDGGTMSITITVGSDNISKNYTVIVYRSKPSGVGKATLSSLVIGGVRVNLIEGKLDYTVVLSENDINDYLILAELTDSENFKFDNLDILSPHDLSGEQELEIKIVPKNANSSYGSETYIITIKSSGSSSSEPPVGNNPHTGGGSAITMGLLLIISFAASIYYYKRNMSQYN